MELKNKQLNRIYDELNFEDNEEIYSAELEEDNSSFVLSVEYYRQEDTDPEYERSFGPEYKLWCYDWYIDKSNQDDMNRLNYVLYGVDYHEKI